MSQHLNDYFALEAGEYLEQLSRLLSAPGQPDLELMLRLSRGVRGSAQVADAQTIARVAERLEDAARAVLSQSIAWSDEIRRLAQQTVGDLQILLRAINRWGPEEEHRVRKAIERWDDLEDGRGDSAGGVVPIASLFFDDAGPHVVSGPSAELLEGVVPIESLLLRGERALQAAAALRPRVEHLAADGGRAAELREVLAELFDLVELARSTEPSPA